MGAKLSKFCGKFPDKHAEVEVVDDGREDLKPKDHGRMNQTRSTKGKAKKTVETVKGFIPEPSLVLGASLRPFFTKVHVEEMTLGGSTSYEKDGIIVRDYNIDVSMIKLLRDSPGLHTIEFVNCSLREFPFQIKQLEGLSALKLSKNRLTVLKKDLIEVGDNQQPSLKRLIVDNNEISTIEAQALAGDAVKMLIVLNMAYNRLSFLPFDFCDGAENLQILVLSNNSLTELPSAIMSHCKRLELLEVSSNNLTSLPTNIGNLRELRKLYVDMNSISWLPPGIGECEKLQKLRLSHNCIRELPDSMAELWSYREPMKDENAMLRALGLPEKHKEEQVHKKKDEEDVKLPTALDSTGRLPDGGVTPQTDFAAKGSVEKVPEEPVEEEEEHPKMGLRSLTWRLVSPGGPQDSQKQQKAESRKAARRQAREWEEQKRQTAAKNILKLDNLDGLWHNSEDADVVWYMDKAGRCRDISKKHHHKEQFLHVVTEQKIDGFVYGLLRRNWEVDISRSSVIELEWKRTDTISGEIETWLRTTEVGGKLEELLLDDNPLVYPSYTAYLMGGPDQFFRLFRYLAANRKAQQEKLRDQVEEMPELENEPTAGEIPAIQDGQSFPTQMATDGMSAAGTIGPADDHISPRHPSALIHGGVHHHQGHVSLSLSQKDKATYYFYDMHQSQVDEIRTIESTLLLMKKMWYVAKLKEQYQTTVEELRRHKKEVPQRLLDKTAPDFDINSYKGHAHATSLDTALAILVYSEKPAHDSCKSFFLRYADSTTSVLKPQGWDELCVRAPITVSEKLRRQMWRVLCWRRLDSEDESVDLMDFVAAIHIHDLEEKDPFISSVAEVHKLLYYEMDVEGLHRLVRFQTHDSIVPIEDMDEVYDLGADSDSEDEAFGEAPSAEARQMHQQTVALQTLVPVLEGERITMRQRKEPDKGKTPLPSSGPDEHYTKVSMSVEELMQKKMAATTHVEKGEDDTHLGSDKLSEPDSSEDSFDAEEECKDLARYAETVQDDGLEEERVKAKRLHVTSDADFQRLMNIPPRLMFSSEAAGPAPPRASRGSTRKLLVKRGRKKSTHTSRRRDPRFATDVFSVRQALRDAFRNLPFYEFVAFTNFLLRELKHIKHTSPEENVERPSYWHVDDPALTHLVGATRTNKYPMAVLQEMGFKEYDRYLVWPEKHLIPELKHGSRSQGGWNRQRLDDMILLITDCHRTIVKEKKRFTGHCRALGGGGSDHTEEV